MPRILLFLKMFALDTKTPIRLFMYRIVLSRRRLMSSHRNSGIFPYCYERHRQNTLMSRLTCIRNALDLLPMRLCAHIARNLGMAKKPARKTRTATLVAKSVRIFSVMSLLAWSIHNQTGGSHSKQVFKVLYPHPRTTQATTALLELFRIVILEVHTESYGDDKFATTKRTAEGEPLPKQTTTAAE